MHAHGLAVDPRFALEVHRAEVQLHALAGSFPGQGEGAAVPDGLHEILIAHAGDVALGTEGHGDGSVEGIFFNKAAGASGCAVVDFKLPLAVQVHPACADKLRAGIFAAGNIVHGKSLLLRIFPYLHCTSYRAIWQGEIARYYAKPALCLAGNPDCLGELFPQKGGVCMKTGLVSVSFRALTPGRIIDLAVSAELDGIEWGGDVHVPPDDTENARAVGEMTRAAGLAVFCYGSYYRLTDDEPGMAEAVVRAASALGAPLIRVWAGRLGSADADDEYRAMVCRNARRLCRLAAGEGMDVAFEYHGGTLTDDALSARALLEAADMPGLGTLWQPPTGMSAQDCAASIRTVAPWVRNIHTFSWSAAERLPLASGAEKWRTLLAEIEKLPGDRQMMLEFVRGDAPSQLIEDACTLRRWLKGDFS